MRSSIRVLNVLKSQTTSSERRLMILNSHISNNMKNMHQQQKMSFSTTSTTSTTPSQEQEILISTRKENPSNHSVVLNRPKALNSLNLSMVRVLSPFYQKLEKTGNSIVVMKGSGEKAFCAGGDVRTLWDSKQKGDSQTPQDFFREEYVLNYSISRHRFTHVALLNGITMGGGVGLSVHGKYRVATEKSVFAMPESGIGFFCDVGGSYFLPRLSDNIGYYLGLTGDRLKGYELVETGVATHYVGSNELESLEKELSDAKNEKEVDSILNKRSSKPNGFKSELLSNRELIKQAFSQNSVEKIYEFLNSNQNNQNSSAFVTQTLKTLNSVSPTSLKVILEQLSRGSKLNYAECFKMEYRIAQAYMDNGASDFFEGVRAVLVDKDKKFNWRPSKLDQVTNEIVQSYFKPLPPNRELQLPQ